MRSLTKLTTLTIALGVTLCVPAGADLLCPGGQVIRYHNEQVGCILPAAPQDLEKHCKSLTVLRPTGRFATCVVCIKETLLPILRECPSHLLSPGDFSCLRGIRRLREPIPPPHGLVAWWPGGQDQGTVRERVDGVDGQVRGGPTTLPPGGLFFTDPGHGVVGEAMAFDGRDDRVDIPVAGTDLAHSGATIEGWIATTQTRGVPSLFDNRSKPYSGYNLYLYRGALGLQLAAGGDYTNYNSSATVADGHWHHVAVTVGRAPTTGGLPTPVQIVFFVDGEAVDVQNFRGLGAGANDGKVARIAARSVDSGGYFRGSIDELAVYGRALTPQEIERLAGAAAGKCRAALKHP